MTYKTDKLYYRTPGGDIKEWFVEVDGPKYRTATAPHESLPNFSMWSYCHAKSVGKRNQRSPEEVALDKAKSMYQGKLDEGYCKTLPDLYIQDTVPRAMLARPNYDPDKFAEHIKAGRVYAQPKFDGFRCIASAEGLFTRELRRIETCPHILAALAPVFEANDGLIIDGELYNHDYAKKFEQLQSMLTKEPDLLTADSTARLIEYHVYDFISGEAFAPRFVDGISKIRGVAGVKLAQTIRVKSEEHVAELHARFTAEHYEGTMIRISSKGYEQQKRAAQLTKLKDFFDEEVEVVEIQEGNGAWAGACKAIGCRDSQGRKFGAGCSGTFAMLAEVLENPHKYIGGKATIKYQSKFASGKPRFPIATKFFPHQR